MNSSTLRKCGVLQLTLGSPPWFSYTSTFHIGITHTHSFQCKSRTWRMTEEMIGMSVRWSHRPSTAAGLDSNMAPEKPEPVYLKFISPHLFSYSLGRNWRKAEWIRCWTWHSADNNRQNFGPASPALCGRLENL